MTQYNISWNSETKQVVITLENKISFSMSPLECERMIRMIRATYYTEKVYGGKKCLVCGDPKGHGGLPCNMFDIKI